MTKTLNIVSICKSLFQPYALFFKPFALKVPLVASMVVIMAPLSFRLALNFFKQSTVSCRWKVEAYLSRWLIQGCDRACSAVKRFLGSTWRSLMMRSLASVVTENLK